MNRLVISVLFTILIVMTTNAQRCLSSVHRNNQIEDQEKFQKWTNVLEDIQHGIDAQLENTNEVRTVVKIPIVVHVLWRLTSQNISTDQIKSQIEVLNEDFRKLNANFNMTPSAFEKVAADIEIEFCLASMTPSGMPSNGVIRKQIQEPDIGLGNNYYSSSRGGSDGWDSERYINIWICELGPDVLGFATFPGMADPEESEGIVVQPHFFGREGTSVNSDPNHLGRTLTHEMGHYFGLEHLWGPDFGGCDEDDYIEDTPNQELETYFCPDFPVRDICSPQTPGIMFNNYMDYTDDECMTMFTADQKERMWSTLQIMRPRLMEGDLCTAVYVNSPRESSFVIMSNPFHKQFCIKPRINETAQIRIHSIHGQLVSDGLIQFYNNESMCISADDWEVGIYIATVNSPSVQTSFRLVKI